MTLWKALRYFFQEALVSLGRSWKVSLVAILTIAVSLFLGGGFWLMAGNLERSLVSARRDTRVVAYFEPDASPEQHAAVAELARGAPWVQELRPVPAEEARRRFAQVYPSLADLATQEALPASLEVLVDTGRLEPAGFDTWRQQLATAPGVALVDDDRDWLAQLAAVAAVVRGVGLVLGGVLLGAAVFTIASVIRLTAYLYAQEIAVQRLVGATEFYLRGPFYMEGVLQGLFGGLLAAVGLAVLATLGARQAESSVLASLVAGPSIPWPQLTGLVALGAAAGLVGAVVSLRREALQEGPLADGPLDEG